MVDLEAQINDAQLGRLGRPGRRPRSGLLLLAARVVVLRSAHGDGWEETPKPLSTNHLPPETLERPTHGSAAAGARQLPLRR